MKLGRTYFNILPNPIETIATKKATKNKTILAEKVILVFFIPYVIPIPSESILLDIASIKEFINIANTPKLNF